MHAAVVDGVIVATAWGSVWLSEDGLAWEAVFSAGTLGYPPLTQRRQPIGAPHNIEQPEAQREPKCVMQPRVTEEGAAARGAVVTEDEAVAGAAVVVPVEESDDEKTEEEK